MRKLRKIHILILTVLLTVLCAALFVACGLTPASPTNKDITGVQFNDATVTYDGAEHSVTVSGTVPEGVSVNYTGNKGTDTGVYNATATLTGAGYNTLTLNATLTINGRDITGITFENATYPYDNQEHSVTISGELPEGVSVSYTNNKATDYGATTATATLSGKGYNTLTLTATLTIEAKDITGVSFADATVTYDGNEHTVNELAGVPTGVSAQFKNNAATDAGEYTATAELWGIGYKPLTLTATLTINKAEITANLTFDNATVEYDAKSHSLEVVGNVPKGVIITYYYNGVETTAVTDPDKYTVEAVLSGNNYVTRTLTATLNITSQEEMLYSAFFNGSVYFQNSLDGNRLYRATNSGTPAKVSNDVATYFTSNGTNLYFYSGSLFSQTIKSLSGSSVSTVFNPGRSTYLTCDENGNIYYAKANLIDTRNENGIYKVNVNAGDSEPVRLTTDKANYIAYYDNYIYYCNTSNGSKLCRISVNANNGQGQALTDNKVSDIVVSDGYVYFTRHTLTNSAIQKYSIASGATTDLCVDNGAYLTKVGNYIYYVNKDLFTSNIFGKGIYRISINGGTLGEKILDGTDTGDKYYSLASDGTSLYYYKTANKHFYRYNVSTRAETDLMANFVPSETTAYSAYPYAHIDTYDGEIYFTDVLDGNSLCKYNPETKQTYKVLSDSVSNVYFYNDYMYYSTYIFTNYALWRLNLNDANAEPEKISSHRYENLLFEGDHFYAIRISPPLAYHNYIIRMDLDGQNETELYTDRNLYVTKLYLTDGMFHFTINPASALVSENIYTHALDDSNPKNSTNVGVVSNNFVIANGKYYYYNHKQKTFCSCDMDGKNVTTIATDVDITDIRVYQGIIFYSSKSNQNTGIYYYNTGTGETLRLTDKVGHGFQLVDNKLYFINISLSYTTDYPSRNSGNGHLYCIDLPTLTVTQISK